LLRRSLIGTRDSAHHATYNFWWLLVLLFATLLPCSARAQESNEFLPEIDFFYKLDSNLRLAFQAKQTRENGNPTQAEIGPSLDFYWRPLKNLIRHEQIDDARTRFILLSFGYHYLPSPSQATVNRLLFVAMPRFPLMWKIVASDRNRGELNFSEGSHSWRYRNRLQFEREVTIRSYHPTPYTNVEVYYDSKYSKWTSTVLRAGCQFPIQKHTEFDAYYEHQNNTKTPPNTQVNAVGAILNLYF